LIIFRLYILSHFLADTNEKETIKGRGKYANVHQNK